LVQKTFRLVWAVTIWQEGEQDFLRGFTELGSCPGLFLFTKVFIDVFLSGRVQM
jgi:hypothetical protein